MERWLQANTYIMNGQADSDSCNICTSTIRGGRIRATGAVVEELLASSSYRGETVEQQLLFQDNNYQ